MADKRELYCPSCDKELLEGKFCPYCQGELVRKDEMKHDPEFEERLASRIADKVHGRIVEDMKREEQDPKPEGDDSGKDPSEESRGFFRGKK